MSSQATSAAISTLHTTTAMRNPGAARVAASRASDLWRTRYTDATTISTPTGTKSARNAFGLNGSRSVNHHPYARTATHATPTRTRRRRSPPSASRAFMWSWTYLRVRGWEGAEEADDLADPAVGGELAVVRSLEHVFGAVA